MITIGYDMYWVERPPEAVAAYQAAYEKFHEAVDQRDNHGGDQEVVMAAYDAMFEAETYYFRLNIWGMGVAREAMETLGMLVTDYTEPTFVDLDWNAINELMDEQLDGIDDATKLRRKHAEEQKARMDEHLAWGPGTGGIPIHKLGSNDGWIVTPEEITRALATYDAAPRRDKSPDHQGDKIGWWQDWITWLRGALKHGGFTVH